MVDVKALSHEPLGDQMRLGRNLQNPIVLMENTTHKERGGQYRAL
jgi:hypothetical protein